MRTYEFIYDGDFSVIKATEGEREYFIPLDPANRGYAEYLRYTEWVEAGNNPEDFWTQTELTEIEEEELPIEQETKIEAGDN